MNTLKEFANLYYGKVEEIVNDRYAGRPIAVERTVRASHDKLVVLYKVWGEKYFDECTVDPSSTPEEAAEAVLRRLQF